MKTLFAEKPKISEAQLERVRAHYRFCLFADSWKANGKTLTEAVKTFSRRWNNKPFRGNSKRRHKLSAKTLYRSYKIWLRGGQLPAAFLPHYRPGKITVRAEVLERLINLFCSRRWGLRTAWNQFVSRGTAFGRGRRSKRGIPFGYHSARRYVARQFVADVQRRWRKIESYERAITKLHKEIAVLKMAAIAEMRGAVPVRVPRHRAKQEITYQI